MKKNPHAVALGRIKSPAKANAARRNGKLGGRPPVVWTWINGLRTIVKKDAKSLAYPTRFGIVRLSEDKTSNQKLK